VGEHVNVFAGLLRSARDGDTYYVATRSSARYGTSWRVLLNTASADGRVPAYSFPLRVFERAILSMLREVDPREILGARNGPDDVMVLAGDLERVETAISLIVAEMDAHGESPTLFRRLRAKEQQQRDLANRLADARQKAANPLSESWGEARSLIDALDAAADPTAARLRLRAALRRIVSSLWLLPVARGRARLCAAQVWFVGGEKHRDYLIWSAAKTPGPIRPGAPARQEGQWWARSFAEAAIPGDLDLRKRADARMMEKALAALDLEEGD
jgi:hypothetical protein